MLGLIFHGIYKIHGCVRRAIKRGKYLIMKYPYIVEDMRVLYVAVCENLKEIRKEVP